MFCKAENFKAQITEINNIMPPTMTITLNKLRICLIGAERAIVAENYILKNARLPLWSSVGVKISLTQSSVC